MRFDLWVQCNDMDAFLLGGVMEKLGDVLRQMGNEGGLWKMDSYYLVLEHFVVPGRSIYINIGCFTLYMTCH